METTRVVIRADAGYDDKRYTLQRENTGHHSGTPQWVLRWLGEFVSSHESLIDANHARCQHVIQRHMSM